MKWTVVIFWVFLIGWKFYDIHFCLVEIFSKTACYISKSTIWRSAKQCGAKKCFHNLELICITSAENFFLSNYEEKQSLFPSIILLIYIIWVSNILVPRWSPMSLGALSWSKLFSNVIDGLQNSSLVGQKLNVIMDKKLAQICPIPLTLPDSL